MKFFFNLFLIFYLIYQALAEVISIDKFVDDLDYNDNKTIIQIQSEDDEILDQFENKTEQFENIKTMIFIRNEIPEGYNSLEEFSNDLLNKIMKDKKWFSKDDKFIYVYGLTNGSGIIIVNLENINNKTLEDIKKDLGNLDINAKILKMLDLLNQKYINPENTKPESSDDDDDNGGLDNTAKIVIIVLSCVVFVIIIVIIIACVCKKNKQDAYNAVNQTSFKDNKLLDED